MGVDTLPLIRYDGAMKNYENTAQLRHLRKVQAERKAAAIAKREAANREAARKVGGAK